MLRRAFGSAVRRPYVLLRSGVTNVLFENRLGVQTSGEIALDELGIAAVGRQRYQPIGLFKLRRIMPRHSVTGDDVFIDIGSGMGRAVFLAAGYRFRRVIGVELSRQLVDIAQANLGRCRDRLRCRDVSFVAADATLYEIPDDVTVVFMNNPVQGEPFAAVVRNILASHDRKPRDMRIIYGNPVEEAMLLGTGRVRLIRQIRGYRPGREWSRSNCCRMYGVQPR
jgi:SAM-dependent methyltransferase